MNLLNSVENGMPNLGAQFVFNRGSFPRLPMSLLICKQCNLTGMLLKAKTS